MLEQLQNITLQSQGLTKPHPFGKGKDAVQSATQHLGYIQIDTLSVVERAHHHTLWTRIPDYKNEYLNQLVQEGNVFEYWFHAASFLPMTDFRFALPRMQYFKDGKSPYYRKVDPKIITYMHDRIRVEGPQKARDFQSVKKKPGSWWNWKPAKAALEKLFMQGDLMICGRAGMEKLYDLTERVLPSTTNTTLPTPLEFAEYLVKTYMRAYGVTTIKQITHLKKGKEIRENVESILQSMVEEKVIQEINLNGIRTMYFLSELLENPPKKIPAAIKLLSPFDNAVIHRDRVENLFNYSYRIECYVPEAKRVFGYFALPILFGNQFIGRVDCKAHRKTGEFELIHLHIEKTELDVSVWLDSFVETVQQFAAFNGCSSIKVGKVSPSSAGKKVKAALEG